MNNIKISPPDEVLSVLERVAANYNKESLEYLSIELAAKCVLYITINGLSDQFGEFLKEFHAELTDEQIKAIEEYKARGSEK
jgi:hypothetical protein